MSRSKAPLRIHLSTSPSARSTIHWILGMNWLRLPKLNPSLVKDLAAYVAERADDPKKDRIVVLSAYTKSVLVKYGKLNVVTMEELAASCL